MGQSQLLADEVADTVITNALIVDWWGIVKADGLKKWPNLENRKSGPDIQPDITIPLGAATEVIAGEGQILTAGGIDTHIHGFVLSKLNRAYVWYTTMVAAVQDSSWNLGNDSNSRSLAYCDHVAGDR